MLSCYSLLVIEAAADKSGKDIRLFDGMCW
jgi:hypothetical protein